MVFIEKKPTAKNWYKTEEIELKGNKNCWYFEWLKEYNQQNIENKAKKQDSWVQNSVFGEN